jgi:uncharacterized BrkB/YihY/UPF0761 family membrane protein
MGNFFRGLVLLMLGFLVWVVASIGAAVASTAEGDDSLFANPVWGTLVVISFAIMTLGPALFWLVAPVVSVLRRHRKEPA